MATNTLETTFRVGSLTKMFTSAVILKLVEAEKLSLQDPLSKFITPFPGAISIRIFHLLGHTSRIRGKGTARPDPTLEEQVRLYQFDKIAGIPGASFEYNNFNYILLSYIVQKVTGRPFEKCWQTKCCALPECSIQVSIAMVGIMCTRQLGIRQTRRPATGKQLWANLFQ